MIRVNVEQIMSNDVYAIKHNKSVRTAAKLMTYIGISSLVILKEKKIAGIVTERDLMTRVIAKGLDPEKIKIEDIMSTPVIVVSPNTSIEEAIKIMFQRKIKKLPVVNANGLVGMLSLTDIARFHPNLLKTINDALQARSDQILQRPEAVDFYIR